VLGSTRSAKTNTVMSEGANADAHRTNEGGAMGNWLLERRLSKVGSRLKSLRSELAVIDEQLLYLGDDADDQAIRAMVAETAASSFEARSAKGNYENMTKHRANVVVEIANLEQRQDDLLDQMTTR